MVELIVATERDFSLYAREVIREFAERPYLLLRVAVVGPFFPHRDSTPFVRIVGSRLRLESLMAEISLDQKELRAYFPTDIKLAGRAEFGYASQVLGSIPISRIKIARLDIRRVDPNVKRVMLRDLGPFKKLWRTG